MIFQRIVSLNLLGKCVKALSVFVLIPFLFALSTSSCTNKSKEEYLENGLKGYRKVRSINEIILDGYVIKNLAFFKTDSIENLFVFQLNKDAEVDTIEKYGLGIVFFADKKIIGNDKGYILQQTKPIVQTYGEFKYILQRFDPPATYLDSLHIYLSGREGYTGVIGRMVRLKNLSLE